MSEAIKDGMANKAETKQITQKYSKSRIMASENYKNYRDLLNVLLDDKKQYTREEISKLIDGYLKKGVK